MRAARRLLLLVLFATACAAGARGHASAHPLGAGIVNRYARMDQYRDVVRLTYMLDYGWQATSDTLPLADTDHDRKFSSDELQAFANAVQTNYGYGLRQHVGGKVIEFENRTATVLQRPDVNGFPTLKLTFVYDAKVPPGLSGTVVAEFEDLNFQDNAVWKEMTVYGSAGAVVETPAEFTHEVSSQLDSYPPLELVTIPDQDKAAWSWKAGSGAVAPVLQPPASPSPIDLGLSGSAPLPKPGTTTVTKDSGGFALDWRIVAALVAALVAAVGFRLVFGRLFGGKQS